MGPLQLCFAPWLKPLITPLVNTVFNQKTAYAFYVFDETYLTNNLKID